MFSGLTNQVNSWMGAVKGDQEGADPAAQENVDPVQSEIATDAGEQSFENVPVGGEGEASATRCVSSIFDSKFHFDKIIKTNIYAKRNVHSFEMRIKILINRNNVLDLIIVQPRELVYFQMYSQK